MKKFIAGCVAVIVLFVALIGWHIHANYNEHTCIIEVTDKERVNYDTQKPKELSKRIIELFSNKGDIVADFFCGSGTSMVAAKELGRQYIGCDISKRTIEITNKRLNNI